mmetsp:Transcript_5190/g.12153  ORF Transcript_5190/g.12153 Transcript_5190/m.12153 type:complete len:348 (-) Transcript_5190:4-1047(-)
MSVKDRLTVEQRLAKCPAGVEMTGKPPCILLDQQSGWDKDLSFEHGRYTTASGANLYWETITPLNKSKIERVIVFFHGLMDNIGWLTRNIMLAHARRTNSAVIGVDLPGHGRSEGLHLYIHSWDEFVDEAADFVQQFVLPKQTQWSNVAKRPNGLRLFAHGESMGGGVAVSIAIKHPELFDGMVLIAPMIHISAKATPPKAIEWLFTKIAKCYPRAAILPTKDISALAWSDPETRAQIQSSPLGGGKAKLRLSTAMQLLAATQWLSAHLSDVKTPFIVLHARDDVVTESESSARLYTEAASTDKELKLYEDGMHGELLHGGPTKRDLIERVFADCAGWLAGRSNRAV